MISGEVGGAAQTQRRGDLLHAEPIIEEVCSAVPERDADVASELGRPKELQPAPGPRPKRKDRRREVADDTCSLAELQDTFRSQGGDLKQLMVALAQSDALLNYRKPD